MKSNILSALVAIALPFPLLARLLVHGLACGVVGRRRRARQCLAQGRQAGQAASGLVPRQKGAERGTIVVGVMGVPRCATKVVDASPPALMNTRLKNKYQ